MARRNGDEWYLGSASAVDRTFTFQPSYLEDGVKYLAEIYSNSADDTIQDNKIQVKKYIIDSADSIDFLYHGGRRRKHPDGAGQRGRHGICAIL